MDKPDFLHLTDEQQEAEAERQKKLRQQFHSRYNMSPQEEETARSYILEDSIKSEIAHLEKQLRRKRSKQTKEPIQKLINQTKERLAEQVSLQGRFLEASEITPHTEQSEFYSKIAHAGTQECDCQREQAVIEGQAIRLPKFKVVKQVYSIPLSKQAFLLKCNVCEAFTISPTRPQDFTKSKESDLVLLR